MPALIHARGAKRASTPGSDSLSGGREVSATRRKLCWGQGDQWSSMPLSLRFVVPLALALKKIEVSVAYSVWSALGTALVVAIGIVWFEEPATAMKLVSLVMIIAGLFFLNLSMEIS
jgi:hypothetical protein